MSAHQLPDLIRFARHNSPFYRDLYASLPPDADRLTDLPVVDQQAFWSANTVRDNRVLTGPLSEATVYKTGGTTGAPKFSVYTRDEWRTFVTAFGHGLVDAGLRPGHRVADLFYAGELYASFLFILDALAHCPVDNVRLPIGGAAPLESTVPTLRDFSAQVVAGTPTTLCRLADHVVATGTRPDAVELILFGGEALFADQRRLLAAAFPNAEARSVGYASVDAGLLGRPVPGADPRVHRAFTPHSVVEILDDATDEPIAEPGRPGRVVVTSLFRRLMPIIRYPAGDRAEWTDPAAGHFRILGRAEEGVRVGPVSLYAQDAQDAVSGADTTGRVVGMQLVVRRWDGRDGLILRLATAPGDDDPAGLEPLAKAVVSALENARPLYPDSVRAGFVHPLAVQWARHRDLAANPRTGKLVRVLDERPTA
ncbi:phenylacetate--CoA ligase family protein [Streptomyces sp. WAC05374]|uniref:phenylacetate--CoA ligase family protein n=1 Tax=Streptomyces sp. WAC05374 TaxID=2487420 RepID=UPI000F885EA7|nr:AMP-binding protein [Streptomyces sp. WAC05374]RST07528.1 phenylacetate--CoA ligase family protein [Streptomyces sp. WAC05374]TDF50251.1 phenylacetate--CoA ligase family protein [Streptomyces sp. WAC05374]TDF57975.1 phenylacetate--CoA ligase family protein [Streptomyces sp. WAC05374]TDF60504.1 phenylacetate--CoA ligase family protein [Streptomyces sp. WAC05374]